MPTMDTIPDELVPLVSVQQEGREVMAMAGILDGHEPVEITAVLTRTAVIMHRGSVFPELVNQIRLQVDRTQVRYQPDQLQKTYPALSRRLGMKRSHEARRGGVV